jgi:hypothetical protein
MVASESPSDLVAWINLPRPMIVWQRMVGVRRKFTESSDVPARKTPAPDCHHGLAGIEALAIPGWHRRGEAGEPTDRGIRQVALDARPRHLQTGHLDDVRSHAAPRAGSRKVRGTSGSAIESIECVHQRKTPQTIPALDLDPPRTAIQGA